MSKNRSVSLSVLVAAIALFTSVFELPVLAVERLYFVAADEVLWEYSTQKTNLMMGLALTEEQEVFVLPSSSAIGSRYKKALYRELSDSEMQMVEGVTLATVIRNNTSIGSEIQDAVFFVSSDN